ncbi:hypothetical protein BVG19_g2567 [[Candida] boidinii]|nr:hypothetical protein BVG19_g2567 [[Candida] boidinii]OWB49165.1 hypothetical protein B5S27_g705 [[Candida] boidinii]
MNFNKVTEATYPQLNKDPVFKPVDSIYQDRLRQFIDPNGGYKDLNLPKFYVKDSIDNGKPEKSSENPDLGYIEMKSWGTPDLTRPLFHDVIPEKLPLFKRAKKGDSFGPGWATFWFHVTFKIPEHWLKEERITLQWDAGNEGLVYSKDGIPIQALTGNNERTEFIIPKLWYEDGLEHVFYIEMACNGMFGTGPSTSYTLNKADLVLPNLEANALYYDFWMISDASRELDGPQKYKAREICIRIMNAFDETDVSSISTCREIAQEYLGDQTDSDAVYDDKTSSLPIQVYGIGNCHIDTAWLWPWHESMRKIVRSWITQVRLLERYPEYLFATSQAQQYKWLKNQHPETFKEVKEKIMEGRFLPVGGSWVENDTNIPSGESLSRQFLLGQRFFLDNFGFISDIFWLPDTFGYSTQIPQLCRLSEMPNFLTQKLSWNNINSFPQNTFNWVGIDGSQVLCHMPPANTYTADANFGDVKRSITQHHNLYNDQVGLLLYGKGDGGGGPTPEMMEKLRRIRGLTNTNGGEMPPLKIGNTVSDFYNGIRERTNNAKNLPTWRGELYLEYHRGTYTTQSRVKYLMRTCEFLMRDLEYFATKASVYEKDEYKYPHQAIQLLWEDICLCQFHDILPGSCIEKVYTDEAWPTLLKVIEEEKNLIAEAKKVLGLTELDDVDIQIEDFVDFIKKGEVYMLNTYPWKRESVIDITRDDNPQLSILSSDEFTIQSGKYALFESNEASSDLMRPVKKVKYPVSVENIDGIFVFSNSKLRAEINSNGVLISLYDIPNDREIIDLSSSGKNSRGGNQFVMFDDQPLNFPAWDTELYSLEKYKYVEESTSVKILENGPLTASIKVSHALSVTSSIETIISLDAVNDLDSTSMVKFDCTVEWNENYKFLKVEFPVTVNEEFANYETQFGLTRRPTHFNTTWETAKFEVCSHKFADFSDFNYGISILNDCKYGFATHGNLMRLSLIRAPKYPDEHADIGTHRFKYSILPHKGPLSSETIRAGWEFNDRSKNLHLGVYQRNDVVSYKLNKELVSIRGDENLILSNIKRGEDDDDMDSEKTTIPKKFKGFQTIIIRIYEALGGKGKAVIKIAMPIKEVKKVNILENSIAEIEFDPKANEFKIDSRAFEISTYRVVLA